MPRPKPFLRHGAGALLGLLALSVNVACGDPATPVSISADEVAVGTHGADPESMSSGAPAATGLSAAEREVLLRANGRRWQSTSAAELRLLFEHTEATPALVHVWDRSSGARGLVDAVASRQSDADVTPRVVVLNLGDAGNADDLVALRESQIVVEAYVIAPTDAAQVLGQMPTPGAWYGSAAEAGGRPRAL